MTGALALREEFFLLPFFLRNRCFKLGRWRREDFLEELWKAEEGERRQLAMHGTINHTLHGIIEIQELCKAASYTLIQELWKAEEGS